MSNPNDRNSLAMTDSNTHDHHSETDLIQRNRTDSFNSNPSSTANDPTSTEIIRNIQHKSPREDGKIILEEDDCPSVLGFAYSSRKKWSILSVIFIVQVSMNFNASVYGNAVNGISEEFGISLQAARVGQMIFLIAYAFGSELWAPWSEELGRWGVLQASLFLVNSE